MSSGSTQNSSIGGPPAALFDPWLVWVTIRRFWRYALPAGMLLSACVAYHLVNSFVPTYRASHLLEANQDFVVFQGVMPVIKDLARTEQALFMNSIVLDPVLADPQCRTAPSLSDPDTAGTKLVENLWVSSGGTESRLRVSYKDTDPEAAAMVCNRVVASYLRQRDAFDSERVSNLERWLAPEIQRWEQEVDRRQSVVQKLSEQTLGYAPGQQMSSQNNKSNYAFVSGLRKQIAELSLLVSVNEAKLATQSDEANAETLEPGKPAEFDIQPEEPAELDIVRLVRSNPDVINARKRLSRYESAVLEIEDDRQEGIRRRDYERFQEKVQWYRSVVKQTENEARRQAVAQLREIAERDYQKRLKASKAQARAGRRQAKNEAVAGRAIERKLRAERKAKLAVLVQQYDQERARLEQFGGTTAELQFAQEELSVANDVLHKLRDRVAAIRTERRQDGAVRSLAPAQPPRTPIETLPFKKLIIYSGAALVVPFLFGLVWEIRTQRLTNSGMCDKNGLTVVGEISQLPSAKHPQQHRRLFHESVETLRSNLFLSVDTRETRSIAVVSSMTGEGKSSVASQLAISIANAMRETVLLIDADMRCPEQHDLFGLDLGSGLSDVLDREIDLADAIDQSLGSRLHVLTAGNRSTTRHSLITQANMHSLLQRALKHYRYVIVDTAPVLSAGETLAVASVVDATLLSVMRDVSRTDSVTRATRRLEAAGANLAGAVFNGTPARQYAYRYGDYYHNDASQLVRKAS